MYGESFMHKVFVAVLMAVVVLPQCLWAASSVSRTSVISKGTKVAAATNNILVDAECQESYFGCMDAFCIVENVSGGRCQCSNKHIELSARLKEIMDMDNQTYAITTYGVEHIELGQAANDVLGASERAFDKAMKDANDESVVDGKDKKSSTLSFAEWNSRFSSQNDDEDDDIYQLDADDIANKKGDELYKAAMGMCFEQTPAKCKESEDMLKMLYVQKIRSDCAAFENSLNKQETESYVKLEDAKRNVRDAALTELKNTNKYNLGECALEFKKCMRGENVCGEDWTGCVTLAAAENMENDKVGSVAKQVKIQGELSSVTIAATSMDALLAKKPLCEHVMNECVKEKDNVWDVFVKDVVTSIKTAELAAESDMRTNCLSNISQCYIKGCKDNMDPKDPEGSYDMCLSRPDNYKAFCKVELEPCLNATGGSYENPDKSSLWRAVLARLASMRVDACTDEFKKCLQDDDRCGKDYSKCIGLDNDDVAGICPEDKLTACYKEYNNEKEAVRESLERIAQGVLLNVDNELLKACEKAVTEAMFKVCGTEDNCDALIDTTAGTHSLKLQWCEYDGKKYSNCKEEAAAITDVELGKTTRDSNLNKELHERHYFIGKFDGQIYWDYLNVADDGIGLVGVADYDQATKKIIDMDAAARARVRTEIETLHSSIRNAISAIESDPKVQYCISGRQIEGITLDDDFVQLIGKAGNARFPNLTSNYRRIITISALHKTRDNYFNKYDELVSKYARGSVDLSERMMEIENINDKQNRADPARIACISIGEGDSFGKGSNSSLSKFNQKQATIGFEPTSTGLWGAIALGGAQSANATRQLNRNSGSDNKLVGYSSESSYTYKRQVTTTFSMDTLICHKCIRSQKCKTIGAGLDHCKKWADEEEECTDIQF